MQGSRGFGQEQAGPEFFPDLVGATQQKAKEHGDSGEDLSFLSYSQDYTV